MGVGRHLLPSRGECGVRADGIDVREEDVGACGVRLEEVVCAVEAERYGMVWIERFDYVVDLFGCVLRIDVAVYYLVRSTAPG